MLQPLHGRARLCLRHFLKTTAWKAPRVLGLTAVHYRNQFLFFMRRLTGWELCPDHIYGFSTLPALIVPADIALICGGSLLICLLAGFLPAWNASRLHPVEALRHE